jgi:predicted ribosomally synthesized peptide with SipW-like signal peptide
VLAAGLVLGIGASTGVANWTDTEQVSAEFRADVLPAPTLTRACTYYPGLLGIGAQVRIYWALPEGYTLDDIEVSASTSGLGSVLAPLTGFSLRGNTTRQADGSYRTDGLLGLGSELEIALTVTTEHWQSGRAAVASNAGLLAGIGGNCRNLT